MSTASYGSPGPAQEIAGPSAYGGSLRRFVHLTWLMAITDFRLTYFGSVLGYLWSLMRPLMLFGVLYVVFSHVLRFGEEIRNYPVLLLLNIVLYTFFAEATGNAVRSIVTRESMVRKMQFPRIAIPLSTVLTALINLALNLLAVFVFVIAYGVDPDWSWLLLPLLLVPLVILAAGVAMILSALYVTYRDVQPIWTVVLQLLFYGTPVFYAVNTVPEEYRREVLFNPLAAILEQARKWVVDPSAPGAADAMGGAVWLLVPGGILVALCALGVWIFNREAPRIAEQL